MGIKMKTFQMLILTLVLLLVGCSESGIVERTQSIMDTFVKISVVPPNSDQTKVEKAIQEAFDRMRRVDTLMSTYKKNSEISELNRQGNITDPSKETSDVIQRAIEFSKISGGAFDITIRPLVEMWNEAKELKRLPSESKIKETLSLVGYDKIAFQKGGIYFKREGMKIDLGGIAKGYAVDKAVEALKEEGVAQALVNAGGDMYCLGKEWKVGIQHPRKKNELVEILRLKNKAVATSGDYRRYFTMEGKRFSHIIDPRTGRTVEEVPMSVTIVASDCTTADALSTAVFVLGPNKGMDLIEREDGIEGLIISEGGKVFVSSGMGDFIADYKENKS